ncbi:hypothetical protein Fleli_1776 [Bernardetia litoralis DSM 6794]|uniref:PepSY domain-containing protein n=1 Tax=Bernardetia litoralis (strain ATCC 23117 / DSM 6794 / NBRC 15988 / NCIMB 1366 / Fx l1 / Sio-4) TaxID=880071 RepID=I4AJP0_BERLS|nr:PepSY domain-containing protein [Bernardetia litoralis]AFM04175.1 hypothetical protein Fleli_1776 [Bernardetia litoralis DSM 6794]
MAHSTHFKSEKAVSKNLKKPLKRKPKRSPSFLKKNIYSWHKIIGIITVIPVIFWTLSGLLHPLMGHWLKPSIPNRVFISKPIKKSKIDVSLNDIALQNNISSIKNFRFVNIDEKQYYQIKDNQKQLLYFDTQTGKKLKNGDKIYAEHLARYFLDDQESTIKNINSIEKFETEYRFINRLLPAWKISFERSDNMDIYVETVSDRLGAFNNTTQKSFLWAFSMLHNWSFLEMISNNWIRVSVILLVLSIISLSALSGLIIYGFMWKFFKKPTKENKKGILKRYHRQIGLATAFVTFTFAFSGAYHATKKYEPNLLPTAEKETSFQVTDLKIPLKEAKIDWETTKNISLVEIKNEIYYQVIKKNKKDQIPQIIYKNAQTGKILDNGNMEYAAYLASYFADKMYPHLKAQVKKDNIIETKILSKFSREYSFVFKRLPVIQIDYDTPQKATFFLETTTSRLASKIENGDRREGFSFAFLHKFFLMDFAGKNIRDTIMSLSALGVLVVSLFGLALFIK